MKKLNRMNKEGFSMIELLIAIAISTIVMGCVITLMGYASHSMNMTQARIALQEQAKDVTNHISGYAMEAGEATWDDAKHLLQIKKETIGVDGSVESTEEYLYWFMGHEIYFANAASVDPTALTADKTHLLAEDVEDIECKITTNDDTKKKLLQVVIKMKDDTSDFTCTKDIYMRNQ